MNVKTSKLCLGDVASDLCNEIFSIIPLVLLFLSQFLLGIGQTLYLSLGQSYLDDNSVRTNTPALLAVAQAIRLCGPLAGFGLGYLALTQYIDPTLTPLINQNDPRWLGMLLIQRRVHQFLVNFSFDVRCLVDGMDRRWKLHTLFVFAHSIVSTTNAKRANNAHDERGGTFG